ncbi:cellulose synthase/poly-beta-1,6-N-acetylglucosamine synthase-like glycosyltransferase [Archangium gephyra]|uniref:Cellulose synthase/poly-beta-1,6-N-acetylglucosamine synthase-like glycosyltransferase n=1 Tax=Archangium gephyra TaxID=48 RepID=A0AAC8QFG2_9BACT|nr:glycosyltransferase family 2 protein [Archangium gephyra]AKJ06484.1 Glycosyl transferase, group 2 family protein [Archangium gephyra]REG32202.1 cellulose synthase/poly-beta-1,6-N-acetylglucosamine synthase-like glycosyltransferase [Archangium gephyra]
MFLLLLTAASALYSLTMTVLLVRVMRVLPRLQRLNAPPPTRWPRVSLVMPARNEEHALESAMRSKLANTYPELELVLVDDRSTDATGAIADQFARTEPRLQVVHIEHLPEGWLGKVHAMQRGLERASGEWVLFSDADVHLAPGTLEKIIAYAEREGLGHVTVLPEITSSGFVLQAALVAMFRLLCVSIRMWAVSDPRSSAAMGAGAFNLVRRSALERTPGLEWLKMEIVDDVALGMMLKRSGAKSAVLNGRGGVSLEFYPSLGAFTRAIEKSGASFPFLGILLGHLILTTLECGFLAGVFSGRPALVLLGVGTWALGTMTTWSFSTWSGFARRTAPLAFLGVLPAAWASIRSAVLALVRGGVMWRGTFYPTAVVRAGQRMGR